MEPRKSKLKLKSLVCIITYFLTQLLTFVYVLSIASNFVMLLDTPGEPVGPVVFTNISEGKATFSWNPPENDGCSEVTHYVIEKRETSKISWTLVTDHCVECTYNATKLIKTNEYQFRVSAVNRFGVSRPLDSVPVIAQMQYSKCVCRLYYNFHTTLLDKKTTAS